jgi:hypothetical protein
MTSLDIQEFIEKINGNSHNSSDPIHSIGISNTVEFRNHSGFDEAYCSDWTNDSHIIAVPDFNCTIKKIITANLAEINCYAINEYKHYRHDENYDYESDSEFYYSLGCLKGVLGIGEKNRWSFGFNFYRDISQEYGELQKTGKQLDSALQRYYERLIRENPKANGCLEKT